VIDDLRVCFLGDSFVAGVGDPEHLGWVGRLTARTHRAGRPLTAYNLGVRRDTSRDVLARWHAECSHRLPVGSAGRIVVSAGVNDTAVEGGGPRVEPAASAAHLDDLLSGAAAAGWPVLVAGPPPVADEAHNGRLQALDEVFAGVCARRGVAYVHVLSALLSTGPWMREVTAGDGSHPGAAGYGQLADLLGPAWSGWLARAPS
jgi:lysophospholipase L1-like esterase